MSAYSKPIQQDFTPPRGTAEELAGAIEAATGRTQDSSWSDPVGGAEIIQALDALLMASRPDRGLDALVRSGVMMAILPEVAALVDFGEGIHHKDVWSHTKKVLLRSPYRRTVRWAALFHDIGKVPTRRFNRDGTVTFLGHPEKGARMFAKIARRIGLGGDFRDQVFFLVASHLRAAAYKEDWTDSAVRRFYKDIGGALEDLLDLSRADITSKYLEKVQRGIRQIDLLAERVEALRVLDEKPKPLPTGLGTMLIEHFGIVPGPQLGKLMGHLKDEVEAGRLGLQEEYGHYIDYLERNRHLVERES